MALKLSYIFMATLILVACTERVVFWGVLSGFDLRFWHLLLAVTAILLLLKGVMVIPRFATYLATLFLAHSIFVLAFTGQLGIFTVLQLILFFSTIIISYSFVRYIGLEKCITAFRLSAIILSLAIIAENIIYIIFGALIYPTEIVGPFVKARGILTEPSQAAVWISPVLLVTLIQKRKATTFLLLTGIFLSFSSLALIAMLFSILLYAAYNAKRNNRKLAIAKFILPISILASLTFALPTFQDRVSSAILSTDIIASETNEIAEYQSLGGSVATLALNFRVAIESLFDTYGLGVGFGNFRLAFERYASTITNIDSTEGLFYNQTSGGNLLIRSLAELGLLGPLIIIFFSIHLYRNYSKSSNLAKFSNKDEVVSVTLGVVLIYLAVFAIRKDMWFSFNFSIAIAMAIFSLHYKSLETKRVTRLISPHANS